MVSSVLAPQRPAQVRVRDLGRYAVPAATVAAVAARLPFLTLPPGADEAGFLQVGAQWSGPGSSLYGDYWVDRPPLLIALFRAAAAAGGVVPLRLLGCLAAAVVVMLVAWTARQVGGPRAGRWAALVAAALVVSPLTGALEVNGELLAAPFVAAGVGASVAAVRTGRVRWAWAAGASGVAALLVKQNFVDVAVFGAALLAACVLGHHLTRRAAGRLLVHAGLGASAAALVAVAGTVSLGTSPYAVFEATYPFRLAAARVVAAGGSEYAAHRLGGFVEAWLGSGLALLTACLVVALVRSRGRDPVLAALGAAAAFDAVSIGLGGGYWLHYLLQLVVPLSVAAGLVATSGGRFVRLLPRAALATASIATVGSLAVTAVHPPSSDGVDIGRAIAASAAPGDTLTTLYGEPQVDLAAGQRSPYEHLWSLPVKTLDPDLRELDHVLDGPDAPTWLVVTHHVSSWGLDARAAEAVVSARYHPVATLHGQTVYLLDGVRRATPTLSHPPTQESP
ncbi:glycosyltransferase family 39 protein [Nocardioides flavescens]|uniref:Uncharacterized protein n=1 Tax=Nocardioides flavescens TaxID=2691959 RepID=A0A6L7F228_9ACTN|nr:glycosyltransferase family 39 protein [Nocardioides flavescens]MXG91509.1 hypothetical protein [Nocardioides flavescens]